MGTKLYDNNTTNTTNTTTNDDNENTTTTSTNNNSNNNRPKLTAPMKFNDIEYVPYKGESQIQELMSLIEKELPEPYSIFTYRFFLNQWPELCFLAYYNGILVGVIISKKQEHKSLQRGYIGMIVVDKEYRRKKIGSTLVKITIDKMIDMECDEVVLETIITNTQAISLYENLGFIRLKRLFRYYTMGADAIRLLLPLNNKFLNQ